MGVAEAAATTVIVEVGKIGVGGAAMEASVLGIQVEVVTVVEIHACPPEPAAKSMYHHESSKLFPDTFALPPCGMEPITAYTCPGPVRTLATVEVVMLGVHATGIGVEVGVSEAIAVKVGVGESPAIWL